VGGESERGERWRKSSGGGEGEGGERGERRGGGSGRGVLGGEGR